MQHLLALRVLTAERKRPDHVHRDRGEAAAVHIELGNRDRGQGTVQPAGLLRPQRKRESTMVSQSTVLVWQVTWVG